MNATYEAMTNEELTAQKGIVHAELNNSKKDKAAFDQMWAKVHAYEAVMAARGILQYATYNED